MWKKRPIFLGTAAAALLAATPFILRGRVSQRSPSPVTASYVGNGDFWLTNHTSKAQIVQLWYIEVKNGTNWTEWEAPNHRLELGPHSGVYDTISFTNWWSVKDAWRLRGVTGEKLTGFANVAAAIRYYPSTMRYSLNPFPKGFCFYGHHRPVVSEEVTVH